MEESNNIALYAAVKTLHIDGHDMWSAVSSLTLLIIPDVATSDQVKATFKDSYKLDIPIDALTTIITRLTRDGYVKSSHSNITLLPKGQKAKAALNNSVQDVKREYNSLSADFKNYLKSKGVKEPKGVNTAILNFIDDNIGFTTELVTAKKNSSATVPASAVADYIIHVEKTNPSSFELLQNIFFGRLYLSLIKTRTELDAKAKFDSLNVYLDTNVLLSLLGLKDEVLNKSATEMLDVLKGYKESIKVCVFDATVEETLLVLNSYATSQTGYTANLKVDSVHYRMRLRKMDIQDLRLLLESLPEKIEKLGIEIIKEPETSEKNLASTISELASISSNLKQEKNEKALNHDATILESIRSFRGTSRTRLLEKCKAVFVTQDKSVYVYARASAHANNTFPIAIRPVDIISLLWIKMLGNDKSAGNVSLLRNAVMGYARERLINYQLWDSFVARLEEAQKKGDITREDVGLILASDETEKLLVTNNQQVVSKIIDQDYVKKLRIEREELLSKRAANKKSLGLIKSSLTKTQRELLEIEEKRSAEKKEANRNENKIKAIEGRLLSLAKGFSFLISLFFWVFILMGMYLLVFIALKKFNVDRLASWLAIGTVMIIFFVTVVTGKYFKPTEIIINLRIKIYMFVRTKVYNFLLAKLTK